MDFGIAVLMHNSYDLYFAILSEVYSL